MFRGSSIGSATRSAIMREAPKGSVRAVDRNVTKVIPKTDCSTFGTDMV